MQTTTKEMLEMLYRDSRDLADRLGVVVRNAKGDRTFVALTVAHLQIAETAACECQRALRDAKSVQNG